MAKIVSTFSLESQHRFQFNGFPQLVAHLDSNVWVTTTERLSSVRWDNQCLSFVVSTRENAIKVYALNSDTEGSGLWTLKVCFLNFET